MDDTDDSQAKLRCIGENDLEEIRKLIERAKFDREAIAQLYRIHYHSVAAYVHRRVSNVEDAQDVVSEVFIAMVKSLPSYRWRGVPFRFWLYRIATNKISRWARLKRAVVLEQLEDLQIKSNGEAEHIDTEFFAMVLESLPVKMQDVLSLHYFEGLSIAEMANVLNRSEGTVKSRLHSGRTLMRQHLEKRGIRIE